MRTFVCFRYYHRPKRKWNDQHRVQFPIATTSVYCCRWKKRHHWLLQTSVEFHNWAHPGQNRWCSRDCWTWLEAAEGGYGCLASTESWQERCEMGNSPRIAFKSSGRYRVSTFKIFQIIFLSPKIEILLKTEAIQDMIFWSENSKILFLENGVIFWCVLREKCTV